MKPSLTNIEEVALALLTSQKNLFSLNPEERDELLQQSFLTAYAFLDQSKFFQRNYRD